MKKILLVAFLAATSTAIACDGTCRCGGVKPLTAKDHAVTVFKIGGYIVAGKYIGPIVVVPELLKSLSAKQRAYNLANGIHHSREERKAGK